MKTYELNARNSTRPWLDRLSAASAGETPLDVSLYMNLLTFDNMTKTGFSIDSGTVKMGAKNRTMQLMEANFARIAASAHSIWPLRLLSRLGLLKGEGQFDALTHKMCVMREASFLMGEVSFL